MGSTDPRSLRPRGPAAHQPEGILPPPYHNTSRRQHLVKDCARGDQIIRPASTRRAFRAPPWRSARPERDPACATMAKTLRSVRRPKLVARGRVGAATPHWPPIGDRCCGGATVERHAWPYAHGACLIRNARKPGEELGARCAKSSHTRPAKGTAPGQHVPPWWVTPRLPTQSPPKTPGCRRPDVNPSIVIRGAR